MGSTLKDKMEQLSPERRAEVEARTRQLQYDEQAREIALLIRLGREHQEALELVAQTLKEHQNTLKMLIAAVEQMTEARERANDT